MENALYIVVFRGTKVLFRYQKVTKSRKKFYLSSPGEAGTEVPEDHLIASRIISP